MQGFPPGNQSLTAGGAPVPGVQGVGAPGRPAGINPLATQYPSPQMPWSGTYANPPLPGAGVQGGAPVPAGFPIPSVFGAMGPGALGPVQGGPATSIGGVAGVSLPPVQSVAPPATTGGPHPLPNMPQFPLPQGFPNPFATQQISLGGGAPPQPFPSVTTVTGPAGYHPGLGYFGAPGAGVPALPQGFAPAAPVPQGFNPAAPWPAGFPTTPPAAQTFQAQPFQAQPAQQVPTNLWLPAAPTTVPHQAPPQAATVQPAMQSFWQQLAWQLLQAPAVRAVLGDNFLTLTAGPERMRSLQAAVACLTGPELQSAFQGLSSGTMDQNRFIDSFASAFGRSLQSAGLLPAG